MIQLIAPIDFLTMCYGVSDIISFLGLLLNEVFEFLGSELPSLRPVCLSIYDLLAS